MSNSRRRIATLLIRLVTFICLASLCAGCLGGPTSEQQTSDLAAPPLWSSFDSPLYANLGIEPSDLAIELERIRQVREATQACMAKQGFNYPVVVANADNDIGPGAELQEDDYVRHYGFGVYPAFSEVAARVKDPVTQVIESLPDGERQAYADALYGPVSDVAFGETPRVEPGNEGCAHESEVSIPPATRVSPSAQTMLDDFELRFAADPDVRAIWSMWSDCMTKQGYRSVEHPDDYRAQLLDELGQLVGSSPIEEAVAVAEERAVGERELARASFACESESRPLLLELRKQREQVFVAAN